MPYDTPELTDQEVLQHGLRTNQAHAAVGTWPSRSWLALPITPGAIAWIPS